MFWVWIGIALGVAILTSRWYEFIAILGVSERRATMRQVFRRIGVASVLVAVCAVTPRDLEDALCAWVGMQPTMVSLEPNNLDDVWNDIRRVAEALGVSQRAENLIGSLVCGYLRVGNLHTQCYAFLLGITFNAAEHGCGIVCAFFA